ncbi:MAG TPA: MFS transporter [Anaerolineae bacterium]|nr:MFS transporter [Anaerolineae bacterium]HQH38188.1 MFS transporter [Anaerolineae bacterium]
MFIQHPLVRALRKLRGNARGCVYTEPLWGIPFNLYSPYVSVYMLALGLTDVQIGLLASIGLALQVFWAMMSGPITDKLGRKRTTLIFDIISWSIPCLIWAVAQNFTYFLFGAIVNAVWRVTANSWQCLLVEDTDEHLLVDIYSWIYIAGLLAAFVSPLTGFLIDKYSLIPTIRGLYLLSFVMMTAKFIILNSLVTETQQGLVRMQETRHQPLFAVVGESKSVLKQIFHTPVTLYTAALMIILGITNTVRGTFWSILVTEKLLFPSASLAWYAFARSVTMLLFFFAVMPRLSTMDVRKPMLVGFLGLTASQVLLLLVPAENAWLLLLATMVEACSVPLASTLLDKLVVLAVDAQERARIMGLLSVLVIVVTSPFGWIAGQLSGVNRSLPFILNVVLYGMGGLLTYFGGRLLQRHRETEAVDA